MVTWDPSVLFPPFSSLKGKVAAGAPSPNPTLCHLTIYTPRNKPVAISGIPNSVTFILIFFILKFLKQNKFPNTFIILSPNNAELYLNNDK